MEGLLTWTQLHPNEARLIVQIVSSLFVFIGLVYAGFNLSISKRKLDREIGIETLDYLDKLMDDLRPFWGDIRNPKNDEILRSGSETNLKAITVLNKLELMSKHLINKHYDYDFVYNHLSTPFFAIFEMYLPLIKEKQAMHPKIWDGVCRIHGQWDKIRYVESRSL